MTLILVMDNDCAIGKNGGLLCSLPADMKHFRETTANSVVVMGRKTYESFPKKPLPNRRNIVLSRSQKNIEGAEVFSDVKKLLKALENVSEKIFVIGGAQIYDLLLPYCDEALITRVYECFGGDAFFNGVVNSPDWKIAEASPVIDDNGRNIRFFRYVRV